jgi:predicted DNA-binding transcriptional regulator YafY
MERRKDISVGKFVKYVGVLGTKEQDAKTPKQVLEQWRTRYGSAPSLRSVQGDLEYLHTTEPPLVRLVRNKALERGKEVQQPAKYFLARSQVAKRFITEQAASELALSRQVYGLVFESTWSPEAAELSDAAGRVLAASEEAKRLLKGVRFLPHGGVGRLAARFDESTRNAALEAFIKAKQLRFIYKIDHRNPDGGLAERTVSPLGLVTKDGQVYVVAVTGLSDEPRPYALHRMSNVTCLHKDAVRRPDFDLDAYIEKTHSFSHPETPAAEPVGLVLRVHRDSIYHFRERPLTAQQTEKADADLTWYEVTAQVPVTVQLVPFLVSMGPWVEVIGPPQVRARVRQWVTDMAGRYANDGVTPG